MGPRSVAASIAALAVAVTAVAATPARGPAAVPSRIHPPLLAQGTAVSSPAGPAAVIATGPGGFDAGDLFGGYDDRAVVVGTRGSYRTVRHLNGFDAGESVLLSPDGRRVAGDWGLESSWRDGLGDAATTVVDLSSGRVLAYRAGVPVAWFPDGSRLLTTTGALHVLDLATGAVTDLGIPHAPTNGAAVALSPDGRRAVVQSWPTLSVLDLDTRQLRTLAVLDERRTLAGPGAWTADGRIATWRCTPSCRNVPRVDLALSYLDAGSGTDVDGPAVRLDGVAGARLLGHRRDGDALVVRYRDTATPVDSTPPLLGQPDVTAPPTGHPEVVALRPAGATVLVRLPEAADRVDLARDLFERFGADPPSAPARLLDWMRPHTGALLLLLLGAALVHTRRVIRDSR